MDMSEKPFCMEIYRKTAGHGCRDPHLGTIHFGWKWRHMLQEPFCMAIYKKNAVPNFKTRILCGNLQEKTLMVMSEDSFCVEIYRNNAVPEFQEPHFVWKFTGKNAHGHVRKPILCGNLQGKCRTHFSGPAFCVEIYRKKRSWTLHKSHFVWKFRGKMPPAQVPTSIKHGAFYCYRKNPFSVATLFGEKEGKDE